MLKHTLKLQENVLQILWDVGTSGHLDHGPLWPKARVSAFDALTHYEVQHIQKNIPDFKRRNMELLTSETNPEVLRAMEVFEVKIITHEHITRRRFVKEKRVTGSKIEKLLDVFPQTIFYISLSRNLLIALLSLQSWKAFMQRWMKASVIFLDAKAPSTLLDKTSKAANGILKNGISLTVFTLQIIRLVAEESIPRSGENVALALGAFCEVLPPSAHAIKSTASKFLLDWLFQYEHEHRQWSAAISLGLISSCLHVTDHKQKFQNIKALLEVASCSSSTLVKGACGVGLGFSCQDLLTRVDATDSSNLEKERYKIQEVDLLGKIVRALSQMICQFSPSSSDLLENLSVYFPLVADDTDSYSIIDVLNEKYDDLEEDIWGVAGLVLGLGSCIGAVYRFGSHDAVHKIKAFIISVVPNLSPAVENSFGSEALDMVLSVGSCLALPFVVSFCRRVELMHDNELDHLVSGFRELISELVSVKKSSAFHQSLLMASCIGAGNLLASILNEGYSLEVELIKDLLDVFRKSYFNPHPPLIHLGGMLGVVNALGAGAGTLVHNYPSPTVHNTYCRKESSHILGPLLSSPVLDPQLTSLIQEMFLVAQNSNDHQLQQYAAWAISFLRHRLWFREGQNVDSSLPIDAAGQKSGPQSFSKDTIVMELSLWLMHLNYPRKEYFVLAPGRRAVNEPCCSRTAPLGPVTAHSSLSLTIKLDYYATRVRALSRWLAIYGQQHPDIICLQETLDGAKKIQGDPRWSKVRAAFVACGKVALDGVMVDDSR
ncbi:ARM repeat superfamily protein [Actinidia rufa]|uniref:ARM repeat superfamily protein n=1 Tax=Actinidia rufa TaxID=165716 RepID=A0A7J0H7G2_9ERIC|nr:ARM repeat superfamily protein [Actinidia rufa]